jgi:ribonuclease HI
MPVRIVTIGNDRYVGIVESPSISIPGRSQSIRRDDGDLVVVGRSLAFNGENRERTPNQLVRTCACCGHYFLRCTSCSDSRLTSHQGGPIACHRYRVIYTDGVCLYNGQANAAAGVGVAFGTRQKARSSMLVGEDPDGQHNNHTKQRAELLAAIYGIQSIDQWTSSNRPCPDRKSHQEKRTVVWVIATDSQFVGKGINKWLPKWRVGHPKPCFSLLTLCFCRQTT